MRRRRGAPRKFVRDARGALESLPAAGEAADRIGESKALVDFGRRIALEAEFCFDEAEDYGEDDGGCDAEHEHSVGSLYGR
jgi:hypothetical protein